jgi:hypothetical protein
MGQECSTCSCQNEPGDMQMQGAISGQPLDQRHLNKVQDVSTFLKEIQKS